MKPLREVITELVGFFNGMPNWNHPQTMCNVVPPPNIASIIGSTLCNVFSPNILEGEYSWNIAKTEIESGAMLADLISVILINIYLTWINRNCGIEELRIEELKI